MEKVIFFDRSSLESIEMFHPSPKPESTINWVFIVGSIVLVSALAYMVIEDRRRKDV